MDLKIVHVICLFCVVFASAKSNIFIDYKTIEDALAKEHSNPTGNGSTIAANTLALNFSRYIQTRSNSGKFDLWALTEPVKTPAHPDGFDKDQMIHAAFAHSKRNVDFFHDHLRQLLSTYTKHGLQIGRSNWPTQSNASLLDQYEVVDGLPHGITNDVITMPRLTAAFPFETAYLIKNPQTDSTRSYMYSSRTSYTMPGSHGLLQNSLVFWYAPLIIPTSWNSTHQLWRDWFQSFAIKVVGYPLPDGMQARMDRHYESMRYWSELNNESNIERMSLLGITRSIFGDH